MSVAAIVLAAGGSRRFGKPKPLAIFRGQSLLRRAVASATAAGCDPVIVVLGAEAEAVRAELAKTASTVVENRDWSEGIGASVRAGIGALTDTNVTAAVLLACDQPFVDSALIARLMQAAGKTEKAIVASAYAGSIGIPALFARSLFADLLLLQGDQGAKQLINVRADELTSIDFPAGAIDIDTPADLARVESDKL